MTITTAIAFALSSLPAQGALRLARFWASASGSQSISWTEVEHSTGGNCYHLYYRSGSGSERLTFNGPSRPIKAYAASTGRTVTLTMGAWSPGTTRFPYMKVLTRIHRDGGYVERQTPGSCGGTSSTRSLGPYDCGARSGAEALSVSLASRRPELTLGPHPLLRGPRPYSTCPVVNPTAADAGTLTAIRALRFDAGKLFNRHVRTIEIRASQTFRQKRDAYTTTTERVEWWIKLRRVG